MVLVLIAHRLQPEGARKARSLSLPARCASVATDAQRAGAKRAWRFDSGVFIFQSSEFSGAARGAFLATKAPRPT
jgi:hypothetical protein